MPQFTPQQTTPGVDYLGAAGLQSQFDIGTYNTQQQQQNQMMQGLFGLGAAGIAASDRKLKHNIVKLGESDSGLNIYEFSYNGSEDRYIGHMADEVKEVFPHAVMKMNGYDAVNYEMLM